MVGTYWEERDYLKDSTAGRTRQILAKWGIRVVSEELDDEVTYKGPEHRMRTILNNHPRRPVPMTAMKIAAGAVPKNLSMDQWPATRAYVPAYAARLTSSL